MTIKVKYTDSFIEASPINAENNPGIGKDTMISEFVKRFKKLDFKGKMDVMNYIIRKGENND